MNPLEYFDKPTSSKGHWISIPSLLIGLDGKRKDIKIEIMEDGMPKAMAFFDIDGTLAHLSAIHDEAIQKLFPDHDPKEVAESYSKGDKLGNSFREFDRMKGIYVDGNIMWQDPEVYWKERFIPHQEEIDQPNNLAHNIAAAILQEYGNIAGNIADELYQKHPEKFSKSSIVPILLLAKVYSNLGIPIVGFTANAKVLVEKLVKYLKLSDIFLDIATDENMVGGGKEIAIHYLIEKLESIGILIPKDRLVFIGDSLRGDIGSILIGRIKNQKLHSQGILVLKDRDSLVQMKKQISEDPTLKHIVDNVDVHGLVVEDVPLDEQGEPMLLARFSSKFLEKL